MELVRPNNLVHSKCVFFASRDTSKKALDVKRSIASVLNIEVYIDVYVYDCNFSMWFPVVAVNVSVVIEIYIYRFKKSKLKLS